MSEYKRTGNFDNKIYFDSITHHGNGIRTQEVTVVEDLRNGRKHESVILPDGMTEHLERVSYVRSELRKKYGNAKLQVA